MRRDAEELELQSMYAEELDSQGFAGTDT